MKKRNITLLVVGLAFAGLGCLNGRSGPGQLTRSQLHLSDKPKSRDLDIDSHKDVKIEKLRRVAPDGTTFEVEGFTARANEGALIASTEQAKSAAAVAQANVDMFKLAFSLAAQVYSGGMVKPQPPQVVTNTVFVVPGTDTVRATNAVFLPPGQPVEIRTVSSPAVFAVPTASPAKVQ